MAQQNASSAFPSIASDPRAARVDPFGIPGLYPTKDLLLLRPDVIAPTDTFARAAAAYRTMDSGLLQLVAAGGLRIDHDSATGVNLGALFEEARTNLIANSNTFSGAGWSLGSGSSVTQNATGPDGVANSAWTAVLSSNGPGLYQQVAYSANTSYYASIWMRVASGTAQVAIMSYNSGAPGSVAQVTVTTAWQRFLVPWNGGGSTSTAQYFELRTDQVSSPASATVQIFGAQIEQGAFPTSYIPTGAAAAARGADSLVAPVTSDWFNPTEGTLYLDAFAPAGLGAAAGYDGLLVLDDGTANNLIGLYLGNDGGVHVQNGAGGKYPDVGSGALGLAAGANLRVAASYNAATLLLSVNGAPAVSVAVGSGGLAAGLANLRLGAWAAGGAPFSGRIRRAAYIARAQTAAVLQAMTTTLPANLAPATPNRPGLMSPADKQLLMGAASQSALTVGLATVAQQDDVRQLMIQVAKLQGKVAGYASGFADDYADQSGVDTSSSSGFAYDSTNKLISNAVSATETSQSVPAQTSNSAPSGYVTSASSIYSSSYDAWNGFDQSGGTSWIASNSDSAPWVQRQLPAAVTLGAYTIATRSDASQPMTAWTFLGSNNGTTWTTLDSQSGQSVGATAQKFTISAANQVAYAYYRLNVTGYTSSPNVAELGLLKAGTTSALDLRSVAATASIVPSKAGIFVLVKAQGSGTIAPNTNLIASVTRTRSSSTPTWTQVTLVAVGTVGGFTAYEANSVDISAQPSGSSMGTRLQTASGLAIAAQANVMQWAA